MALLDVGVVGFTVRPGRGIRWVGLIAGALVGVGCSCMGVVPLEATAAASVLKAAAFFGSGPSMDCGGLLSKTRLDGTAPDTCTVDTCDCGTDGDEDGAALGAGCAP